jgi:murein peptide amidase A
MFIAYFRSIMRFAVSLYVVVGSLWIMPAQAQPSAHDRAVRQTPIQQCLLIGHRLAVPTGNVCDGLRDARQVGSSPTGQAVFAFSAGAPTATAQVRVLVIGAIHGDETSAAWLPYQWLSALGAQGALPRNMAVRILPLTNPDGALSARLSRTNANGVDLNRNFPTPKWREIAPQWWEENTNKDPRRWPGNLAASEPETKIILREMDAFKPTVIVSVHAPFGLLDFDGKGPAPQRIGSLRLDSIGIYPGSLGNYASQTRGVPVVTLELPAALRATTVSESKTMWKDLVGWLNERPRLVMDTRSERKQL